MADDEIFEVVINEAGHHSVWPAHRAMPRGWRSHWPVPPGEALCHPCPRESSLPSEPVALPGTHARTIRSSVNGQLYRIFVATPAEEPPPGGFPVLYMLDANSSFLTMAQTMAVLSIWRDGTGVQPIVIVGIGYPIEQAFDGKRRGFDYTPAALPGGPGQHHAHRLPYPMGGADEFLRFIAADVKPLIEREHTVDRGRQALLGHSFGGLFVLHVLFTRPESFQSYVAASPSITWGEPAITAEEARFAADDAHDPIRLLVTAGEYEQKLAPYEQGSKKAAENEAYFREFRMIDQARGLVERQNALRRPQLTAEFRLFQGEGHMSLVPASASHSLRFVSAKPTLAYDSP